MGNTLIGKNCASTRSGRLSFVQTLIEIFMSAVRSERVLFGRWVASEGASCDALAGGGHREPDGRAQCASESVSTIVPAGSVIVFASYGRGGEEDEVCRLRRSRPNKGCSHEAFRNKFGNFSTRLFSGSSTSIATGIWVSLDRSFSATYP